MNSPLSLPHPPQNRKNLLVPVIIVFLILALAGVGIYWYLQTRSFMAQQAEVEGEVIYITAPVEGQIKSLFVREGDQVKKGQAMLVLDDAPLRQAAERARLALQMIQEGKVPPDGDEKDHQESIKETEEQIRLQRVMAEQWQQSLEHWTAEHAKAMLVLRSSQTTQSHRHQATLAERQSREQMEQARAQVEAANSQRADAENTLRALRSASPRRPGPELLAAWQARLEEAEYHLAHTTLYAPDAGTILNLAAEEGIAIYPGQQLFSLVALNADSGAVWITAWFDARQAGRLQTGQTCIVRFTDKLQREGTLMELLPEHNGYKARIIVPGENLGEVYAGQEVEVHLPNV